MPDRKRQVISLRVICQRMVAPRVPTCSIPDDILNRGIVKLATILVDAMPALAFFCPPLRNRSRVLEQRVAAPLVGTWGIPDDILKRNRAIVSFASILILEFARPVGFDDPE